MCLNGRYPALCRHGDLTQDEARRVAAAELQNPTPPPRQRRSVTHFTRGRGSSECEDGHWIEDVMDDGALIKLEDGSLWKVDDADVGDSAAWVAATEIVVCDGKLINTDDDETVEAERIH